MLLLGQPSQLEEGCVVVLCSRGLCASDQVQGVWKLAPVTSQIVSEHIKAAVDTCIIVWCDWLGKNNRADCCQV